MVTNYLFILCCLSILSGCHMPPTVNISSSQIAKNEITTIKNKIIAESYSRYDEVDDVPHCVEYVSFRDCYFLTRYIKEVDKLRAGKSFIFIMLSYKKDDRDDYYKNVSVNISENQGDNAVLNAEFERISDLLFREITRISDGKVERSND